MFVIQRVIAGFHGAGRRIISSEAVAILAIAPETWLRRARLASISIQKNPLRPSNGATL
jgi:hypothetical protein